MDGGGGKHDGLSQEKLVALPEQRNRKRKLGLL
jgi:hypothetical protein